MKEKQIKEMARAMDKCHKRKMTCDEWCALIEYATSLYKAGYRKQPLEIESNSGLEIIGSIHNKEATK